ncbi:hypothetical protein [Azospirillum argentinense]
MHEGTGRQTCALCVSGGRVLRYVIVASFGVSRLFGAAS